MKKLSIVVMALGLSVATLGLGGCVIETDPAAATCNDFDVFLQSCYPTCYAGWDCEYYYDLTDSYTQGLLDECSICLRDYSATCQECYVTAGPWCMDLLADNLGMDCVY